MKKRAARESVEERLRDPCWSTSTFEYRHVSFQVNKGLSRGRLKKCATPAFEKKVRKIQGHQQCNFTEK